MVNVNLETGVAQLAEKEYVLTDNADPVGHHLELEQRQKRAFALFLGLGLQHVEHAHVDQAHAKTYVVNLLDQIRRDMGTANFEAQYQQNPVPPGGSMIKTAWFATYTQPPAPEPGDRIVISWDTAMKSHELADYSVALVFRVRKGVSYLLEVVRERLDARSGGASDARWSTYLQQRAERDPFDDAEPRLPVRTVDPLPRLVDDLLVTLWRWNSRIDDPQEA